MALSAEDLETIARLAGIGPQHWTALHLHLVDGWTDEEICRAMHLEQRGLRKLLWEAAGQIAAYLRHAESALPPAVIPKAAEAREGRSVGLLRRGLHVALRRAARSRSTARNARDAGTPLAADNRAVPA